MEKPRLMLIGPFPPPFGGVANITAQLASSDLSRMFRLRTLNICLPTEKTENTGDRPVNLWKTLRVFLNALHAITHEQPDAVLLEMNSDISCFREMTLALLYRWFTRATVVTHFHGSAKERHSWRLFPFIRERWRSFPDRFALNAVFAPAHKIVFLSPVLRDQFREGLSHSNWQKATWVENFVPVSRFGARRPDPEGRPTILFVGRLSAAKGFVDLVRAIPSVLARHPRTVFTCCGAPEVESDLDPVRPLLRELQDQGSLRLLGIVERERKADAFAGADLMVYPSRLDMFPVTILEGLAQGLPLVATPVGVLPSILKEPENALFTPPGEPAPLADRLCTLLEDPALRERMGKVNRELAWRRFDIGVAAGRLCAILKNQDPDTVPT